MIQYERLGDFNRPFFEDYEKVFHDFIEGGWYILGKNVEEFERRFGRYVGCKHCVGVASGFDAIQLALHSFNFPAGSEIIMPSNSYVASIFAALHCSLKVVLVPPDIRTYNIDHHELERYINNNTTAILVIHLYGKACDMGAITKIASGYRLKLIEDCAQAHGAKFRGRQVGAFGNFGAFSFYPTKNLGALGDAGAVTTNEDSLAETVRMLRNYGSPEKNHFDLVGFNSRLDELQAALLLVKLHQLDAINEHKRKLAMIYLENLKDDFIKPHTHEDYYDVFHIFAVRHPERDALKEYLLKNGIETQIHYPVPPHKQKALTGLFPQIRYPVSEEIHDTILSLPISFYHSEDEVSQVVEVMNRF